jgi:DNA-binding response OmpR family regulator
VASVDSCGVGNAAPKILVVDDDPSLRLLCRVNLELDGFEVEEAGTLDEAREAALADGVGLVLLDVHLGTKSSLGLLDELKRERPQLPVVLLTGESGLPDEARGRADLVLPKPFEIADLSATVGRLLV